MAPAVDTFIGRNLILWTVRLAVALYCYAVWIRVTRRSEAEASSVAFAKIWFASWAMCVIHVLCAYHFEHRWSQVAALKHTAEMTDRVVGWYWAGGLYVNYVFLLAWGIDAFRGLRLKSASLLGMQLVAAFMMFNATVVFGPIWWLVPAILFCGVLLVGYRSSRARVE